MTALQSVTSAIARDRQSKPFAAFTAQNPGIAPLVIAYLDGGARPTDEQLGLNHYAHARVASEDARRALLVTAIYPSLARYPSEVA